MIIPPAPWMAVSWVPWTKLAALLGQWAAPAWIATPTATVLAEARVGSNAEIVCGASLLTLIVIFGILWHSRFRGRAKADH